MEETPNHIRAAFLNFGVERQVSFESLTDQIRSPRNADRVRVFRVNSTNVDRHGTVIMPEGMDLTLFRTQGRFLEFHDKDVWPIGRPIALSRNSESIDVAFEFDEVIKGPEGDILDSRGEVAFQQVERGNVNTVSIGFLRRRVITPRDSNLTEQDRALFRRFPEAQAIFTETELYEVSLIPVPSNTDAVQRHLNTCFNGQCHGTGNTQSRERSTDGLTDRLAAIRAKLTGQADDSDIQRRLAKITEKLEVTHG